jgi:hypothetical protein
VDLRYMRMQCRDVRGCGWAAGNQDSVTQSEQSNLELGVGWGCVGCGSWASRSGPVAASGGLGEEGPPGAVRRCSGAPAGAARSDCGVWWSYPPRFTSPAVYDDADAGGPLPLRALAVPNSGTCSCSCGPHATTGNRPRVKASSLGPWGTSAAPSLFPPLSLSLSSPPPPLPLRSLHCLPCRAPEFPACPACLPRPVPLWWPRSGRRLGSCVRPLRPTRGGSGRQARWRTCSTTPWCCSTCRWGRTDSALHGTSKRRRGGRGVGTGSEGGWEGANAGKRARAGGTNGNTDGGGGVPGREGREGREGDRVARRTGGPRYGGKRQRRRAPYRTAHQDTLP